MIRLRGGEVGMRGDPAMGTHAMALPASQALEFGRSRRRPYGEGRYSVSKNSWVGKLRHVIVDIHILLETPK